MFAARHLHPTAAELLPALRRRRREVWPLRRRGADLGHAVVVDRTPPTPREAAQRWCDAEAVFLPGMLGDRPRQFAAPIASSLAMFERLRRGGALIDELTQRLASDNRFAYVGRTRPCPDPRDVEFVVVEAVDGDAVVAPNLWAKLAMIAPGRDRSLRIRFAAGTDQYEQWMATTSLQAGWVDVFARSAFRECDAVLGCRALRRTLDALLQRPHRLSERILYNNAPDGGAVFHHDAEPGQLGVVFSQLQGRTGWLALPKLRLADLLVRAGHAKDRRRALLALDDNDERLLPVLNRDADFTALVAAHGGLFVLEAGDCILLPSHSIEQVTWHSVIGLGEQPSLAHSYGLFPADGDYPLAGDPFRR